MLATTFIFISAGMVAPSMGFSDSSFNSLLLSPSQNTYGYAAPSANHSLAANYCPGSVEGPSVRSSDSDSLVYKYDQVAPAGPGVPFGHGFFKHSCHPDPSHQESSEEEEPLCLYLKPSINEGAGMVVVSRGSTLQESLENQLHLSDIPERNDAFEVVEMPEKGGMGAIASRRLEAGELVINSRATLLISVEGDTYNRPDWKHICKLAVDLLPLKGRAGIARLFGTGETQEGWISSAIEMNAFEISLGGEEGAIPFFAIFLTPSRLNHDCRPNTAFHVDSKSLEIHMHALRAITPGEEMTISYRDMGQIREKRQEEVSHYGFKCSCAHCRMNHAQAAESDRRLERLLMLSKRLLDWDAAADEVLLLEETDELLELYKLERLDNNIADGYTIAAVVYNSFGHTRRAARFASQALASGLSAFGTLWDDAEPLRELTNFPELHWSYRARSSPQNHNIDILD
ncbi:hypothetical protein VP01_2645g2 [Puccinia sorghi]|uniref:SET domain-containing protein n=1 Tax=Puccinia sorghi TaxID=27349 RepID=A0A0L6V627_9BASI|nr:hypothetical protein VP01_2645g2 [Puccinia sorghi]